VRRRPGVSRRHALLELLPDGRVRIRDLNSVNGVLARGGRITEPILVADRERIGIGPYLFGLADGLLHSLDSSRGLRLEARGLEREVRVPGGTRKLLTDINLTVEPGEFVTLLGPSGSGKSTLMDCLNGRRRATGGVVLANGEDFYRHFDSFRQSLGYVPQRDIVHRELTVYRALYYTARLRLPTDTTSDELRERVEGVLEEMDLGEQRNSLVADLSGGQIKRVSLGAELLARPSMLYIDEATSGLDAGTESRMMHLFRRLADEGRSILCITHNVDNVDRCHLVLVLAAGRMVFCGPTGDALTYFRVDRMSEVYERLVEDEPEDWQKRFQDSRYHEEFVERRLAAHEPEERGPTGLAGLGVELISGVAEWLNDRARAAGLVRQEEEPKSPLPEPDRPRWSLPPWWHQFRVLTARYIELLRGDRRTVGLLLLQAPAVALVLLLGFVAKPYRQMIPAPRPMTAEERNVLALVDQMMDVSQAGRPLTPEQREALT
jgi:ABC-type multidrug transport system ATPase subunit